MGLFPFAKNGMGSYEDGTGMREDMHMQAFNIFNYQAGVVLPTDLVVTETSPASMAVKVSAGRCFVPNSSYTVNTPNSTKYWGVLAEEATLSIDPNTSGSNRVDLITVKIDAVIAPGAYGESSPSFAVVKGAAGGATPALPNNSLLIATLTIPTATTTTITSGMIADNRVLYGTTYTQNAVGNIEVRYGRVDEVDIVIVPEDGDLEDALTNADYLNGSYEVQIHPGTHTLTITPTINATCRIIHGVNGSPAIRSTSVGTQILNIAASGTIINNIVFDLNNSTPNIGLNITGSYVTAIGIYGLLTDSDQTLLTGSGGNCRIDVIGISALSAAPKLFNWSGVRSILKASGDLSGSGFTWALSGDRNIVEVICDTAGSNTGTGNNVTEVVY